jgi:putative peptide zinc metalloprotease protein
MTLQLRPTFSESWYRVQHLKPKLRGGAQISRQFYRGERWYVVRDPAGNQYHRLSDAAYAFVGLLDGHRTIGEAWELVGGQLADDAPTQPEVIQILTQLYAANLIETNISLDATVLLRRYKKQQMQKTKGRLMNILFPRIPIWDPDWWLKMWMPLARVVLSPAGMVVWLIVVGWAMFALLPHWDKLKATGWETINFSANPINALWLGAAFIVLKLIHEAGHGFFCRRFGGEVHELGVMFLVLMPAPYVDASSAWSFPNKWHRILVGAGGMVFEIFVAALAAFVWINTMQTADPMGQWIHQMAYNIMLIASVSTVVFNANPLLRYDGYYMLSDYLEIPNLQHRSREYSLYLIKRHLFRVKWSQPLPPVNHRPWLLLYNYTSGPYRIFVGLAIMLMVLYQLPEQLKILGMILFLGSIITFFGIPLYKSLKYLLIEPELHRKRTLAWSYTLGFIGLIGLLVGYFNFPFFDVRGEAVLLPLAENRAPVFPRVSGRVEQVVAKDGQPIKKGDTILVMANEQLVAEYDQLVAQMDRIKVQMRAAEQSDPAVAMAAKQQLDGLTKQLEIVGQQMKDLTIVSPIDGTLVAPNLIGLTGTYLERTGERNASQQGQQGPQPIAQIYATDQLVAYAIINQKDAQLLTEATEAGGKQKFHAHVRLASNPGVNLKPESIKEVRTPVASTSQIRSASMSQSAGGSQSVDPSDPSGQKLAEPQFEMPVVIDNTETQFLPGQKAYVRVTFDERRTLWWYAVRYVRQMIQTTKTQ